MWATMAALAVVGAIVFAVVLRDRHMVSNP
jgi:hypothetical protein